MLKLDHMPKSSLEDCNAKWLVSENENYPYHLQLSTQLFTVILVFQVFKLLEPTRKFSEDVLIKNSSSLLKKE